MRRRGAGLAQVRHVASHDELVWRADLASIRAHNLHPNFGKQMRNPISANPRMVAPVAAAKLSGLHEKEKKNFFLIVIKKF